MSTRSEAIALKESEPYLTLPEIGQRLGVSKQRIFRILKNEGLPTRGVYQRKRLIYCPVCHILLLINKQFAQVNVRMRLNLYLLNANSVM